MAFHLRHGQGQGIGAPVFRAGGPHNVLEVVGKRDLLGEIPLFQQGGLDLLRLQRVLSRLLRLQGHGRDGYRIRQRRFFPLILHGLAGRHHGQYHDHKQDGQAYQERDPLSGYLPAAFLAPASALRAPFCLCSLHGPGHFHLLALKHGVPLHAPADFLQFVLPSVAGLHGPDPAFQVVHVLHHAPVLFHGLAVFFRFPLAHFLAPPVKNTRLTS